MIGKQSLFTINGTFWLKKKNRTSIPNQDIFGFRGEAVIEAPMAKILTLAVEPSSKLKWVDRMPQNKIIKTIDEHNWIEGYRKVKFNTPIHGKSFDDCWVPFDYLQPAIF